MRKFVFALFTVLFCASTAFAGKIGVVDIQAVAGKSEAAQAAREKVKKDFSPKEAELKRLVDEFTKKKNEFQLQAAALSASAREDKKVEIVRLQRDLQDKQRAFARELQAANNSVKLGLSKGIVKAINTYAKKNGYDMIISRGAAVPYANSSVDVTNDILVEVNRLWRQDNKK